MTRLMHRPLRIGDRYLSFIVVREDKGWGGPYGQRRIPAVWECEDCGYRIPEHDQRNFDGSFRGLDHIARRRLAEHHECGHAPCAACGQLLLRRIDGTPRQHAHNRCPGKGEGDKIEREFVKHMTRREYA